MSMSQKTFSANTLYDLINLLYPGGEGADNQDFYDEDNLLMRLEFVSKNLNSIASNSNKDQDQAKDHQMYYLVIVSRLKELYCMLRNFEKAFHVEKLYVHNIFQDLLSGKLNPEHYYFNLVMNELVAVTNVFPDKADHEVFEVIQLFPIQYFSMYTGQNVDINGKTYGVWVGEEQYLESFFKYVSVLVSKQNWALVHKYIYICLHLIYQYADIFNNSDVAYGYFTDIKYVIEGVPDNDHIKTVFELYQSIVELMQSKMNSLKSEQDHEKSIQKMIDLLVALMKESEKEYFEAYKDEIFILVKDCNKCSMISSKALISRLVLDMIEKVNFPKYKKEAVTNFLLDYDFIPDLAEVNSLQAYEIITKLYFTEGKDDYLHEYHFQFAYALNKTNHSEEAFQVYKWALENGYQDAAIYNNIAAIYNNYYNDPYKALEYYQKAEKLSPDEPLYKDNIQRVLNRIEEEKKRKNGTGLNEQELTLNQTASTSESQIVSIEEPKLYRSTFCNNPNMLLFKVMVDTFPQHLIYPDMNLQMLFEAEKMKEVLNQKMMKIFNTSRVSFVVINQDTYLPIIAFENDPEGTDENAEKMDIIFRLGGIPLIRLNFNNDMDYNSLQIVVKNAAKTLLLNSKKYTEMELSMEFNF